MEVIVIPKVHHSLVGSFWPHTQSLNDKFTWWIPNIEKITDLMNVNNAMQLILKLQYCTQEVRNSSFKFSSLKKRSHI